MSAFEVAKYRLAAKCKVSKYRPCCTTFHNFSKNKFLNLSYLLSPLSLCSTSSKSPVNSIFLLIKTRLTVATIKWDQRPSWDQFKFPYFGFDFVQGFHEVDELFWSVRHYEYQPLDNDMPFVIWKGSDFLARRGPGTQKLFFHPPQRLVFLISRNLNRVEQSWYLIVSWSPPWSFTLSN